jgi:S-methylmethionine-dependent homocysteine/selenocysteine methylase
MSYGRPGVELGARDAAARFIDDLSMSFTQLAEACVALAPANITLNNGKMLPLLLLDGGMGTYLSLCGHNFSGSPLWSASLIEKDGDAIIAAHSAYLEAGADIIMTNTFV